MLPLHSMIFAFKIGFLEVSWVDVFDIALASVLLYQVYKLIRGSIAVNIFLGILALYLVYLIVRAAQMELRVVSAGDSKILVGDRAKHRVSRQFFENTFYLAQRISR
jgi:DNA integrity scanning protein DisA with diadenylate cyclase activity